MEMQCEADVLFSSNFGCFSVSSTLSGGAGGLLNGQNPLSVTKIICRRSLTVLRNLLYTDVQGKRKFIYSDQLLLVFKKLRGHSISALYWKQEGV